MSIFDDITKTLERAIHLRPNQLKGTPGIAPGHEAEAAAIANTVLSVGLRVALAAAPSVADNALHVRPESLHGVAAIHDPVAAAAAINDHVETVLAGGR